MKSVLLLLGVLLAPAAPAQSPYAGQESRAIKALSAEEISAFLEGKGQGFAKPAELNGFPGPMHVLELAEALQLTPAQHDATQRLLERHKSEARALGREWVENEKAIERLFASREANAPAVAAAVAKSAEIHARIRTSHLVAHLEQTALLQPAQLSAYNKLRGYEAGGAGHAGHGARGGQGHKH